ncbi:putative colanic acid biosynthesis acetyltransferase WcaF [Pedobacter westerhofensis]|uniref:Putative colanic acid biosynthesis acetyltransferase WcaF n=1 Tax=Pedobacter westerhofensis TaxID=425512 RepID=A0A521C5J4_9SPHI|nr:WcaF family extracellular polysaccharide biosynthesis acetyltransferase [Pedobacter westerhofensis]SMO54689.1 putative colanic acid biosynthesis acetyltransferase WcaF [Pedobacter westerhofensis]
MTDYIQQSKVNLGGFDSSVGLERGAGKLKEISWYLIKVIFFLSALPYPNGLKCLLLRLYGAKVGSGVVIKPRVNIHFPWKLDIGNDVWIGEEAFLLNFEQLIVGNNVCISQRAFLCGGNHDFRIPEMPYRNGPITLMDGAWIGASVFISPGVTVGIDSVVTAGSVVTGNIAPNGIYKGNPIVYIKQRW